MGHLTKYASDIINSHFQKLNNYSASLQMVSPTLQKWHCGRHGAEKYRVVLIGEGIHCSCALPTNMLLPCVHVMTVNLRMSMNNMSISNTAQPKAFILDQVGQRWRRDWLPPTSYREVIQYRADEHNEVMDEKHIAVDADDTTANDTTAYEIIKEDVLDRIDDMLSIAKGRSMIARRLAVMVQQLESKYRKYVKGDLNGDSDEVKNPIPRDTTKRQKRYPSKHERAKKPKTT
jgi:hypothetical protein